jgi:hypothetical protein
MISTYNQVPMIQLGMYGNGMGMPWQMDRDDDMATVQAEDTASCFQYQY